MQGQVHEFVSKPFLDNVKSGSYLKNSCCFYNLIKLIKIRIKLSIFPKNSQEID